MKLFLQESTLICSLYVNISIYLERIIDRYLFIVIYAYYKYASIIVYTNTTVSGTH
jgi:hypothetical protein